MNCMRFFTDAKLETFYGKPIHTISPTDQPLNKYISGQNTVVCKWCEEELQTHCTGSHSNEEMAYCESCDLRHKRLREIVSNDVDYDMGVYRTDEREEYICPDCKERHPFTIPVEEEFTIIETPQLNSYEQITVTCYCGEQFSLTDVEIPHTTFCSRCSRRLSVSLQK